MSDILITPDQLQAVRPDEHWLIFDVRHDLADHEAGRKAYDEGHIPGAVYLDHERQLSAPRTGKNGRHPLPDLSAFTALMRGLGVRPDVKVAVYDASGGAFATHLWWMLRWMGHEQVAVLDGGWNAWLDSGGLVEAGTVAPSAAAAASTNFVEPSAKMPTVDAAAIMNNLTEPAFVVIDARAAERYRGEVEPMDPVAGHIPGALNRPNSLNLQDDGRFKPARQLHEEFVAQLGPRPAEQVVHQCGSGITATHNLFAMELAGLTGSALYPGSWSEWCSDSARPVAQGKA